MSFILNCRVLLFFQSTPRLPLSSLTCLDSLHTSPGQEPARVLVTLKQGKRKVTDYVIEFRTLAADSKWNAAALADAFFQRLSGSIKDHIVSVDSSEDLDLLIAIAIKKDKRLVDRQRDRGHPPTRIPLHLPLL